MGPDGACVGTVRSVSPSNTTRRPPPNDHFTNRIVLTNDVELITYRNVVATTEPGAPLNHAGGRSVWYEWTPIAPGLTTHLLNLPASGDPAGYSGVSIYCSKNEELVPVTNTCGGEILFSATNGQKYFLQFDTCPAGSNPANPPEPRWLLSHASSRRAH